eukprot:2363373-Pyramimonas_sp.AAC.1
MSRKLVLRANLKIEYEILIAIRGSFDGGVSSIGAGGGWWLDGEFALTRDIELAKGCDSSVMLWCCPVEEEAFGLFPRSPVTECELESSAWLAIM